MRKLLLILALALFIVCGSGLKTSQIDWMNGSIGSQIHGVTNGTSDQDAATFSQTSEMEKGTSNFDTYVYSVLGLTMAVGNDWTIIHLPDADSAHVLNAATALGGDIFIANSMSIGTMIDVPLSETHIVMGKGVVLTATSSIDSVFMVDPVTHSHDIANIEISGGLIDCNNNATQGIRFTGHYTPDYSGYASSSILLENIWIQNAIGPSYRFNATSYLMIRDCNSYDSGMGIQFDEACVNDQIDNFMSMFDTIGVQIGGDYPAPHTRCEGISIYNTDLIANQCGLNIRNVLYCVADKMMIDQSYENAVKINGTNEQVIISNSYLQNLNAVGYLSSVEVTQTASDIIIEGCQIGNSPYYGVSIFYDGVAAHDFNRMSVTSCNFYPSATNISTGGDIYSHGVKNLLISGNQLRTSSASSFNIASDETDGLIVTDNFYAGHLYNNSVTHSTWEHNIHQ